MERLQRLKQQISQEKKQRIYMHVVVCDVKSLKVVRISSHSISHSISTTRYLYHVEIPFNLRHQMSIAWNSLFLSYIMAVIGSDQKNYPGLCRMFIINAPT